LTIPGKKKGVLPVGPAASIGEGGDREKERGQRGDVMKWIDRVDYAHW
jgi:hypothetical protein